MRGLRGRRVLLASLFCLLLILVIACGIGSVRVPPAEVLSILADRMLDLLFGSRLQAELDPSRVAIIWNIRLPRVLLGLCVGMALAVAGGAYQGLFQNPMADPYILGVSSGSALGAALAIVLAERLAKVLPHTLTARFGIIPLVAFAGGMLAVTLVYRLAKVGRRVPVVPLLLAGVAVGALASAVVSLILFFAKPMDRETLVFWLMGGLGGANWAKVGVLMPYLLAGIVLLVIYGRELNALLLGEETAAHMGVDVEKVKRVVLVAGALLTATSVAFAGTIGFVGLIVPHLVRFLVGPDHRYLLPASGIVGGGVLVAADTFARSALGVTELPVGLVMAVVGGPFFLWLLRRRLQPREG